MVLRELVRDRTALALACGFAGGELIVTLLARWSLGWAIGAAVLTGTGLWLVSFTGGLVAMRLAREPASEQDLETLLRQWSRNVTDDDPARLPADDALKLASEVVNLNRKCDRRIAAIDGEQQADTTRELHELNTYLDSRMRSYLNDPPQRRVEWSNIVDLLTEARDDLQQVLDKLR